MEEPRATTRFLVCTGSFLLLAGAEHRTAMAESVQLVRDINTQPRPVLPAGPDPTIVLGNLALLSAYREGDGRELWGSDGTESGSFQIKDICQGPCSSWSGGESLVFARLDRWALFAANDGIHGRELWRTDGTEEGTVMVMDLNPGCARSEIYELAGAGAKVFFFTYSAGDPIVVWVTDGTAAGTVPLRSFPWDLAFVPPELATLGDTLVFSTDDSASGRELWRSDGTVVGTRMVRDIRPGADSSRPHLLTVHSGAVYFAADDGTNGLALWRSDGSEAGTTWVRTFSRLGSLTSAARALWFSGDDGATGSEPWRSDGTAAGTELIKDIVPGALGSGAYCFTTLGQTVLFSAWDPLNDIELWRSDGTEAGTVMVKDIAPGPRGSSPSYFTSIGNIVFFRATESTDYELWRTDGTATGTWRVKQGLLDPQSMLDLGGTFVFAASSTSPGIAYELWRSDGTDPGTVQIPLNPGGGSTDSNPRPLLAAGGQLFFGAHDGFRPRLWRSDTTEAGTTPLVGSDGGPLVPASAAELNGMLVFTAAGLTSGRELWRSDGTDAGTTMVKEIRPGLAIAFVGDETLVALGGRLFFAAYDGTSSGNLWVTDGTGPGTVRVDVPVGVNRTSLMAADGRLFFAGSDLATGAELWRTDGTRAGTSMVADIAPGNASSSPQMLGALPGLLLFSAETAGAGRELWRSDGTPSGTSIVKDICPGAATSFLVQSDPVTAVMDGVLYFNAWDCTTGPELWRSDGTAAGTRLVHDVWAGPVVPSRAG